MAIFSTRFRRPLACFWYICADNKRIEAWFLGSHYQKRGCIWGGLECEKQGLMFEKWIVPSSTRCLDNLGIQVHQVQFCEYAKLIGQIPWWKWRVSNSTLYLPRLIISHSRLPRPSTSQKGKIGGGVPKSGSQLKIIRVCCCNGCLWAQNCKRSN
jgi:hypothetical protein